MPTPRLRHIAALWSLDGYPKPEEKLSIEARIAAIAEAGFDGMAAWLGQEHKPLLEKHGLIPVGYFTGGDSSKFADQIKSQVDVGATHINVQMADHDTPVEVSAGLAVLLVQEGEKQGAQVAVEIHRDTCTETPEKTYAIADAYQAITGKVLPMTLDYSHIAVVKHVRAPFADQLLVHPEIVQRARQIHFRPFNGHHAQVPVTDGKGGLSDEIKTWLPFADAVFKLWLEANKETDTELMVCPEMGPIPGGYNLSLLPNSWEDAKVLRGLLAESWAKALVAS